LSFLYILKRCPQKKFKQKLDGFNILGTNCRHQHVKCYELHQVMWQNDIDFIHVFNKFQTTTQTIEEISYINNICLKPTPLDNVLLYFFYINVNWMHIIIIFW